MPYKPKKLSIEELITKLTPGGLVPPQAVAFEQSILGAMMIDKASAALALEMLGYRDETTSPFYREAHTRIYLAMLALESRHEAIDLLTVTNQLRLDGKLEEVGGTSYLVELSTQIVTTVNIGQYCKVLIGYHVSRELIRICEETKLRGFEGETDSFALAAEAMHSISNLESGKIGGPTLIGQEFVPLVRAMDDAGKIKKFEGVRTGFEKLDKVTRGWQAGEQVIIAARPGCGKSAALLQFAFNAARNGEATVFFSLEMKKQAVIRRLVAMMTGIDHDQIKSGALSDDEFRRVMDAGKEIQALPLYIDDQRGLTPMDIRSRVTRIQRTAPIRLVCVDYLQKMQPGIKVDYREREVAYISGHLFDTWGQLNVAGLVACQLNRDIDKDKPRRPMLSDLRESGAIEQDADIVMFIHYPEVRDFQVQTEHVEFVVAKNRDGAVGIMDAYFKKHLTKFEEFGIPDMPRENVSGLPF